MSRAECVKTNKYIFKIFSLSGSHAILVLSYQTTWQYSDGNPPPWGRQMQVGQAEIAILSLYLASLHAVNDATGQVLSTRRRQTMVPQVVKLIAGSKRRSYQ